MYFIFFVFAIFLCVEDLEFGGSVKSRYRFMGSGREGSRAVGSRFFVLGDCILGAGFVWEEIKFGFKLFLKF